MESLSPIAILWHQWTLSISYIFDTCACILNSPTLPSFSSLSTFCRVLILFWPEWPYWMVVIVIYWTKYDSEKLLYFKLCQHMLRKGCVEKFLSTDFKESEEAESFERNCQVCLWAISWIWEWKLFTERTIIIINVLTYLRTIEFFCDILCGIYFPKASVLIIKLIINLTN